MAFNKAGEQKKWNLWKEKEEQQLREYGMEEEAIALLRKKDWEDFNAERRFREHNVLSAGIMEGMSVEMPEPEIHDIRQIMDVIEDKWLLHTMMQADRRTLQIVLLKMMGYSIKEIAANTGMCDQTIYTKLNRLKKKIKKVSKSE